MAQVKVLAQTCLSIFFIFSTTSTYTVDWQCEWDIYFCDNPYSIDETLQFKCKDVNDCPTNFMCCNHKCFRHKICQPYKNVQHPSKPPLNNLEIKPDDCDIKVTCDIPLPETFTKSFECFQDNDCPDYYKCCFVTCYNHKVCQPARNIFGMATTNPVTIPPVTTKLTTTTESTTALLETSSTENLEDSITLTTKNITEETDINKTVPTDAIKPTTNTVRVTKETDVKSFTTSEIIIGTITNSVGLTGLTITEHIKEVLTTPPLSTDDFEASGDLEIDDDDEDGKSDIEDDIDTTVITTTIYHREDAENVTKDTLKITRPQSLTTTLVKENNDFKDSENLIIVDDDEDEWNKKKEHILTTNDRTPRFTTSSQWIQTTQSLDQPSTSDFDFEITDNYESDKNKTKMDITKTEGSMKEWTKPPNYFSNKNDEEIQISNNYTKTNFQTKEINSNTDNTVTHLESLNVRTDNLESNGSLETIRSDTTFTTITTEQAQTNNDSLEKVTTTTTKDWKIITDDQVTITVAHSQLPNVKTNNLESNDNLQIVGTAIEQSNTSSTTTPLTLTTFEPIQTISKTAVKTQAQPLRETTVPDATINDLQDLGIIIDMKDKHVDTLNRTIKFMGSTETTTTSKNLIEVTVKADQSKSTKEITSSVEGSGDYEASGDFDITEDDEDRRVNEFKTVTSLKAERYNVSVNGVETIQPELTDLEASGDLEIIRDDEE